MLTGTGSQAWMTAKYQEKREKALKDRTKYSDERLEEVDILDKPAHGGGRTNDDIYEIDQFPFPLDQSIRSRKKIDIRKEDPRVGGD